MDKVGKQDAAQREGAAILQAIQQAKIQQQTDERIRSVNEAQNMGDGTEAIKDKNGRRSGQEGKQGEQSLEAAESTEETIVIRDPDLGRNIDLTF